MTPLHCTLWGCGAAGGKLFFCLKTADELCSKMTGPSSYGCLLRRSGKDPLPPVTTGSLRVAQFAARQKPFLMDFFVPKAELGSDKQLCQ